MYVGTYSGAGKIVGQVQLHGVGYQAFYVLAPLENPAVVLSSGATDGFGNFSVEGIDARKRYIVYAVDQPGSYNMRGWSHVTPVLV
jgi:hypothetical protein